MDVHIDTTVYAFAEDPEAALWSRAAMRKDMPHCYLGRVEGASEISLYVLFPHLTAFRAKPLEAGNGTRCRGIGYAGIT
jgi:hypothetical protein